MYKIIAIGILLASLNLSSQINTDTLNKTDILGKKQGYWLVYLTDKLIPTSTPSLSSFYAFNYYDNNVLVGFFPIGNSARKNARKIDYHGLNPEKDKIILLNGTITYYDRDSVSLQEKYVNGVPIYRQGTFYNKRKKSCKYKQTLDYDHKYKNEVGSFYYQYFDYVDSIERNNKHSLIEKVWYRKKNEKWRLHYENSISGIEYNVGSERYDISKLDRNGKGSSLFRLFRKYIQPRLNLNYEQSHIKDQWLRGGSCSFMIVNPYSRTGISWTYYYARGFKPIDYGYPNQRFVDVLEKGGWAAHFFFIYKRSIKSSISVDFLGDTFYTLYYTNPDGTKANAYNKYGLLKPGILTIISITKNIGICLQGYYRWQYDTDIKHHDRFGAQPNFKGFGFSVGLSIK